MSEEKKKKRWWGLRDLGRGKWREEYYSMKQVPKVDARLSCLAQINVTLFKYRSEASKKKKKKIGKHKVKILDEL